MRLVDFPFVKGVDEQTHGQVLPAPRLVRAENVRIDQDHGLVKRRGYTETDITENSSADDPSVIRGLGNVRGSNVLFADNGTYVVDRNNEASVRVDRTPQVVVKDVFGVSEVVDGKFESPSTAYSNGYLVTGFRVSSASLDTGTYAVVNLASNGAEVVPQFLATTFNASRPVCIGLSDRLLLFFNDAANIKCQTLLTDTPANFALGFSSAATIVSDLSQENDPANWDVSEVVDGSDEYVLVYEQVTSKDFEGIRNSKTHSSQASGVVLSNSKVQNGLCVYADNSLGVNVISSLDSTGSLGSDGVFYIHTDLSFGSASNLTLELLSTTLANGALSVERLDATTLLTSWDDTGREPRIRRVENVTTTPSLGANTVVIPDNSYSLVSQMFAFAGDVYGNILFPFNDVNVGEDPGITSYLISDMGKALSSTEVPYPSAHAAKGLGILTRTGSDSGSRVGKNGSGKFFVPITKAVSFIGGDESESGRIQINIMVVSVEDPQKNQSVELGGILYSAGGSVFMFDGAKHAELSFHEAPDFSFNPGTTGGMALGTYQYAVVWEWRDSTGARHQSAPTLKSITLTGSEDQVDVVIKSLKLTNKHLLATDPRPVIAAVYRTEVDGTVLFRREVTNGGATQFPLNDQTLESFDFDDDENDADSLLISQEQLYTNGDVLENQPPPPSTVLAVHKNRLFGYASDDKTLLWFTKESSPDFGIAWNPVLSLRMEEDGDITALASQDSRLVVFKKNSVFLVFGNGPNNLGDNNFVFERLSTDVGCDNSRSVVSAPGGVYFSSGNDIWVMTRGGGQAILISKPVRSTLQTFPFITSAVHVQDAEEIRWTCLTAETGGTGRILVFDYRTKNWFVHDLFGSPSLSSAVIFNGKYVVSTNDAVDATLYEESETVHDDWGNFVTAIIETGDLRFAGLSGFYRVNRIEFSGEFRGQTGIVIEESTDSGGTYVNGSGVFDVDSGDYSVGQIARFQYCPVVQKNSEIRFRITESNNSLIDSEGISLFGLTADVQTLPRGGRLASGLRG